MTEPTRLPDFIIIGAAKAATTSLHAILDQHDAIFMPKIKEPEFFARDDLYEQGIDGYQAKFSAARPNQIIGEASTIYSMCPLFPKAPTRIKKHIPNAKIIYIMREPVKRAYSFYVQLIKTYQNATGDFNINRTFEDMILPDRHTIAASRDKVLPAPNAHLPDVPELCLAASDYAQQIEAYFAHFSRDQFLFLKFEDFIKDQQTVVRQITNFLGVAPIQNEVFDQPESVQNITEFHFAGKSEVRGIEQVKARAGRAWVFKALIPNFIRKKLRPLLSADVKQPPKMEPATRKMLSARFVKQLPDLERQTGLRFDDWKLR